MKSLTLTANAKINTYLDISALRPDSYHDIVSVMQSISLCDIIRIEYEDSSEKKIGISCSDPTVPTDRKNTAYVAAERFPCTGNIRIHIEKNIPHAAGLGGGSADAAAVIIGLDRLTEKHLDLETMMLIGKTVGADVPFCIAGGSKLIGGIGDVIGDMPMMPDYPLIVAMWGEGMSTPSAYRSLDEKFNRFEGYSPRIESLEYLKIRDIDVWKKGLYNIFEEVVLTCRPDVAKLKGMMYDLGALSSMMSGSGAAVFGIFEDEGVAQMAADKLKSEGANVHLCRPVSADRQMIII